MDLYNFLLISPQNTTIDYGQASIPNAKNSVKTVGHWVSSTANKCAGLQIKLRGGEIFLVGSEDNFVVPEPVLFHKRHLE